MVRDKIEEHTHTRPFYGPLSWSTQVSRYQKKHPSTHSTTMFPYVYMDLSTFHVHPLLFPSLGFSSVANVHLHQSISTLLPLPYLMMVWTCVAKR